ncbi:hypothetical protein SKAU_G00330980 [Synaphobranchus kaupii]|uniref:AT-rich interactive domain-containing protein 1B-like n=1 Tax=Synaphobranchus kaupii TaxID=118154 RepID=A0A9Q1ELA6_SYNKA|nr:hypothetical protein SKAU_G00330980 [Synaphobranchus kaupii]
MAAQVASAATLNTSPPAELKKPDRDPQEETVPGENQQENKEAGSESGSPGQKELQDGADVGNVGGGGDVEMKNGNGNPTRVNNNKSQNDSGAPEGNSHPGMAHHHSATFPPPSYGYSQHYSRGPFHQHGGQQSAGMAAPAGGMMDSYQPNSHEHGYPNHQFNSYSSFTNRTPYPVQGYTMSSPRNSQPPAAGGQPAKQQPAGGAAAMAASYNNQRYNVNMGNPQPTSTPTLNHLLTSPSSARGYQNYPLSDYSNQEGTSKGPADIGSGSQYGGGPPGLATKEPSPVADKPREQKSGCRFDGSDGKDAGSGGSSYPGQGYGPQGPQRYPMSMQGRTPGMSLQYGQQMAGYGQQSQGPYYSQQTPPPHGSQQASPYPQPHGTQPAYPQTQGSPHPQTQGSPHPQTQGSPHPQTQGPSSYGQPLPQSTQAPYAQQGPPLTADPTELPGPSGATVPTQLPPSLGLHSSPTAASSPPSSATTANNAPAATTAPSNPHAPIPAVPWTRTAPPGPYPLRPEPPHNSSNSNSSNSNSSSSNSNSSNSNSNSSSNSLHIRDSLLLHR